MWRPMSRLLLTTVNILQLCCLKERPVLASVSESYSLSVNKLLAKSHIQYRNGYVVE